MAQRSARSASRRAATGACRVMLRPGCGYSRSTTSSPPIRDLYFRRRITLRHFCADSGRIRVSRFFVTGGAGFVGSHLVRRLLERPDAHVVVYDNFTSGQNWHLQGIDGTGRLRIVRQDLKNMTPLKEAMAGVDAVFHFASNPDIARAVSQPDIDFWEGTYLTQNVLEAMRVNGVPRLLYASGSGVYGNTGTEPVFENYSPLRPI